MRTDPLFQQDANRRSCQAQVVEAVIDRQPELVRTMSVQLPRGVGWIRLLEISGVDPQPCGGTHLASTIEIGTLVVAKVGSNGRRNKGVYLALAGHNS